MPTLTKTQLRELVENELAWDPEITTTAISVMAEDGAVMLSGFVPTYAQRNAPLSVWRAYGPSRTTCR